MILGYPVCVGEWGTAQLVPDLKATMRSRALASIALVTGIMSTQPVQSLSKSVYGPTTLRWLPLHNRWNVCV